MRTLLVLLGIVALVALAGLMTGFIKLDQTQTAQLPQFEATVGKVDVGTVNKTVEVPKVDVQKPQ
jgi:hypothetical protein